MDLTVSTTPENQRHGLHIAIASSLSFVTLAWLAGPRYSTTHIQLLPIFCLTVIVACSYGIVVRCSCSPQRGRCLAHVLFLLASSAVMTWADDSLWIEARQGLLFRENLQHPMAPGSVFGGILPGDFQGSFTFNVAAETTWMLRIGVAWFIITCARIAIRHKKRRSGRYLAAGILLLFAISAVAICNIMVPHSFGSLEGLNEWQIILPVISAGLIIFAATIFTQEALREVSTSRIEGDNQAEAKVAATAS